MQLLVKAARHGVSLPLLQALRARGAAIDLVAVAAMGSEAALEWAAGELIAERGGSGRHGGGGGGCNGALLGKRGPAPFRH